MYLDDINTILLCLLDCLHYIYYSVFDAFVTRWANESVILMRRVLDTAASSTCLGVGGIGRQLLTNVTLARGVHGLTPRLPNCRWMHPSLLLQRILAILSTEIGGNVHIVLLASSREE